MQKIVRLVVACALAGSVLGAVACVNPRDDYDDFVNRTNGIRGVANDTTDAAVQEAAAIDGGFVSAPFFMACLPRLVGGNLLKALRFAGTVTYTPSSTSSKAGTIDIEVKALAVSATDLTGVVGDNISAPMMTVRDDGTFDADFGAPTVPLAANPITTNDIVFGHVILRGKLLRADRVCGELDGDIALPAPLDLNDPGDYCFLQGLPSLTAPAPVLTSDDFQPCP